MIGGLGAVAGLNLSHILPGGCGGGGVTPFNSHRWYRWSFLGSVSGLICIGEVHGLIPGKVGGLSPDGLGGPVPGGIGGIIPGGYDSTCSYAT